MKEKKNIFYYLKKNINKNFRLIENKSFNNPLMTKEQAVNLVFEKMKFYKKDCNKIFNINSSGNITIEKLKNILKKNKLKYSIIKEKSLKKNTNFKGFENIKYFNKNALIQFFESIN